MATTQILNYLEQIKNTVSAAERTYNREGRRVEWDSLRTTSDLFGDSSAALELIVRARSINNAYYSALAGAGEALDAHCRPLLAQNPDASAIKAVADYLKYICDEISSMGTNFTASVNGRSYGNVASDRFSIPPQISAARIYWQTTYDSSPAAKEAARREKQQREERARRAQEARKKREAERAQLAARLQPIKDRREQYQKDCSRAVEAYTTALSNHRQTLHDRFAHIQAQQRAVVEADLDLLQTELLACGVFAFGRKKSLQGQIFAQKQRLAEFDAGTRIQQWDATQKSLCTKAVKAYRKALDAHINACFPVKEFHFTTPEASTPEGIASNSIRSEVLKWIIDKGGTAAITQLEEKCPCLADLTRTRITSILQGPVNAGVLTVSDRNNTRHYTFTGELGDYGLIEYAPNEAKLAAGVPAPAKTPEQVLPAAEDLFH